MCSRDRIADELRIQGQALHTSPNLPQIPGLFCQGLFPLCQGQYRRVGRGCALWDLAFAQD
jgi:hypothetical protein